MTQDNDQAGSDTPDGSALRELAQSGRLALKLLGDGRVPSPLKLIPVVGLLYLLWPIDLLPDTIPFVTQLDDLAVILIAMKLFISMAPDEVVAELEGRAPPEETIDADYRVHEG